MMPVRAQRGAHVVARAEMHSDERAHDVGALLDAEGTAGGPVGPNFTGERPERFAMIVMNDCCRFVEEAKSCSACAAAEIHILVRLGVPIVEAQHCRAAAIDQQVAAGEEVRIDERNNAPILPEVNSLPALCQGVVSQFQLPTADDSGIVRDKFAKQYLEPRLLHVAIGVDEGEKRSIAVR